MTAEIFRFDEAQAVVEVLRRTTGEASDRIERLRAELKAEPPGSPRIAVLEGQADEVVRGWAEKVASWGGQPKGMWLVDFESGRGFLWCWSYPEREIGYVHGHEEGFAGRRPIGPAERQGPLPS